MRSCLFALAIQLDALNKQIAILDPRLAGWHRTDDTAKRLDAAASVAQRSPLRSSPASRSEGFPLEGLLSVDRPIIEAELERRKRELGDITKAGDHLAAADVACYWGSDA